MKETGIVENVVMGKEKQKEKGKGNLKNGRHTLSFLEIAPIENVLTDNMPYDMRLKVKKKKCIFKKKHFLFNFL